MIDLNCNILHCTNFGEKKAGGYCFGHYEMNKKYGSYTPELICVEPSCKKSFIYLGNSRPNHWAWSRKPYCEECCDLLLRFKGFKFTTLSRITRIAYLKSLVAQDFKCAICNKREDKLCADHDHKCCEKGCLKCFRKLLCYSCNSFVGHLEKNSSLTALALKYIDSHKDSNV